MYLGLLNIELLSSKGMVGGFSFMPTEEDMQFEETNDFLRGFFSFSVAFIIYGQWTRIIAFLVIIGIINFPLGMIYFGVRLGKFNIFHMILPPVVGALVEPEILYYYHSYDMLLMLFGASTALISYALIHHASNNNPRIVIPVFIIFFLYFSSVYIYTFEKTFRLPTLYTSVLFVLAVIFGLRFWFEGNTYNERSK
jgi:hypothetical protein